MGVTLILIISVFLQFAAAFLALRLIQITGRFTAWVLIAAAIFLMAVRRSITLFRLLFGDISHLPDLSAELVALAISVLMVAGIAWIAPLLLSIRHSEEAIRKSRAYLVEAQRISHLGNWNWDIVNNELGWSEEIYRIFGLTPQEFETTYEAFLNSVHPDDREFVKKSVDEALYEGKPYTIEHRIILPDGTERIVYEKAEVTFDEAGKAIRMIGTVQDITERKEIENALRESEERYRDLIESTYDIIQSVAPDGRFVFVNRAWLETLGYTEAELPSLNLWKIIHPESLSHCQEVFSRIRAGESIKNI